MSTKINRRQILKTATAGIAAISLPKEASPKDQKDKQINEPENKLEHLTDYAITHGGIQSVKHPKLGIIVNGQTSIRYLRFARPVRVDHLELGKIVYGRAIPQVPCHPAHIIISILDPQSLQWRIIREVDFPMDPRIVEPELSQEMNIEEMEAHFERILKEPPFKIDLDLKTDHLRIVCDREHEVWANHGEFNGGAHNVPFGIMNNLKAFGILGDHPKKQVSYKKILHRNKINPVAPKGMQVHDLPDMLLYKGRKLSIGFSLIRPTLMHLGWDSLGDEGASTNRLFVTRHRTMQEKMGGISGPMMRTLNADYPAHLWTGDVTVDGNKISYQNLNIVDGLNIDAIFTVERDRIKIELTQTCDKPIPVIEAYAWRFAWDLTKGITGMAGVPSLSLGRNGDVKFPALWATDGNGSLACNLVNGNPETTRLQAESYRYEKCASGGFIFGEHSNDSQSEVIPAGKHKAVFELTLDDFEPEEKISSAASSIGLQRHWGTVFSCFRPEFGGFSNHAASGHCHLSQGPPLEIAAHTKIPKVGPNPIDLARFTISRAFLGGGGYGYWRNLYLDTDPVLVSAAGRIHHADPNLEWLKKIETGLVETTNRILSFVGKNGMVICRDLSGNSGSYRWSTNSFDVVGFGHIDGYVNAWAYRALRNAAAMLDDLGNYKKLVTKCRRAATNLRMNYASVLLNPETEWIAGWRSRDNQLHDYGFIWVNGVALAFGLLENNIAQKALSALEEKRTEVGPATARLGLPCNLYPIQEKDHMLAKVLDNNHPTFETYTDGSLSGWSATYYLRALSKYGDRDHAKKVIAKMSEGYEAGVFNGGHGTGHEFRSWEGLPTGYEGTLIGCFGPLYAIAIEEGVIEPQDPEWWPENG
jgi:hypothetical protein